MNKFSSMKLSEERSHLLKRSAITLLKTYGKMTQAMDDALMLPKVLTTRCKPAGYFLQEPGSIVFEAHYLHSGRAILYSIDEESGMPMIFFIWEPNMIIMMHKEFRDNLPSGEYFIKIIDDAELVTITNFCKNDFYQEHPEAYEITTNIITSKKTRMMLQMSICLKPYKSTRRKAMDKKFPGLRKSLSNEHVCAFLGVRPSTLGNSKP